MKKNRKINKKNLIRRIIRHIIMISIGFIMLYPVLWLVGSSFKPTHVIFSEISFIPSQFYFGHYPQGFAGVQGTPFMRFIFNSIIISSLAIVGNLISCTMAGFAFARLKFRFKGIAFALMLMTVMLPIHVVLIPRYIMFNKLNLINTFVPLVLPKFLATDGFFVFLIIQFIRGIPISLDEAAIIDGCSYKMLFWKIILPLTKPALISTAIFTFLWTWDDFLSQLVYLSRTSKYTVQLGLRLFLDSSSRSDWGATFAMSVMSLIPCLIVFAALQKYIVEGIATTGLKG